MDVLEELRRAGVKVRRIRGETELRRSRRSRSSIVYDAEIEIDPASVVARHSGNSEIVRSLASTGSSSVEIEVGDYSPSVMRRKIAAASGVLVIYSKSPLVASSGGNRRVIRRAR